MAVIIYVNIAPADLSDAGTDVRYDGAATPGHMWIETPDGEFGYGNDGFRDQDSSIYQVYESIPVIIPDADYNRMLDPLQRSEARGYTADNYVAVGNNCITYTWEGLCSAQYKLWLPSIKFTTI